MSGLAVVALAIFGGMPSRRRPDSSTRIGLTPSAPGELAMVAARSAVARLPT
jgi:hypothetical protein